MVASLSETVDLLKAHERELRERGVRHVAVFGSVSRGQARDGSDVDNLVELDPEEAIGVFGYSRLKLYINEILGGRADVVNRTTLKPLLRERILKEAVSAF